MVPVRTTSKPVQNDLFTLQWFSPFETRPPIKYFTERDTRYWNTAHALDRFSGFPVCRRSYQFFRDPRDFSPRKNILKKIIFIFILSRGFFHCCQSGNPEINTS